MTQLIPAQRVILDTQVCSHAAMGKISSSDGAEFCTCLKGGFVHCISPLVAVELLYGLYAGNDTHFRVNQDKLRHLYQASNALIFLPLPGQFLAKELFAVTSSFHRRAKLGMHFRRNVELPKILKAASEYRRGGQRPARLYRFAAALFDKLEDEGTLCPF